MKGATNPQNFDRIVREVFAPIYPVIADQIKDRIKITCGKCLDAGCGTGALGRAMAKITNLDITFFDQSDEMLELAKKYANIENINHRSSFLQGDIHSIPLKDESIDIVISRGSSPFWEDWHKAYSEIFRILKPGGMTYIGGGFGNAELREGIVKIMNENNPNWRNSFKDRIKPERDAMPMILASLNPTSYEIVNDDSGFWTIITK
ncbi:MAG: class I SAM-dependent methyltransferase [Sulfurovaceae bacterium]|nr:class I SAM-dependent methyltransferase [Sulfurovaceae bacterium]